MVGECKTAYFKDLGDGFLAQVGRQGVLAGKHAVGMLRGRHGSSRHC